MEMVAFLALLNWSSKLPGNEKTFAVRQKIGVLFYLFITILKRIFRIGSFPEGHWSWLLKLPRKPARN